MVEIRASTRESRVQVARTVRACQGGWVGVTWKISLPVVGRYCSALDRYRRQPVGWVSVTKIDDSRPKIMGRIQIVPITALMLPAVERIRVARPKQSQASRIATTIRPVRILRLVLEVRVRSIP